MRSRLFIAPPAEVFRGRWPLLLALLFAMLPVGAGPQGAQEGSGLRQVVLVLLYLAAAFAIVRFPARLSMIRKGLPLGFVLLLLYASVSAAWSPEPWVSFKRVVQVIGIVVLGMGLLVGGGGRWRLSRVLPPLLLFTMLLAIAASAAFPNFAFAENGLRAFMATKNNFGQFAALSIFIPLVHVATGARWRWLWIALAVTGMLGLVLSRSATTAVAVLGVGALYAVVLLRRKLEPSWGIAVLVAAMLALVAGFAVGVVQGFPAPQEALSAVLAATGRDATLTGRTYLWELMINEAMRHPWFGLGYGGFWLGLEGASGQVAYLVRWGYPGQAHNGYLDLFNELGVAGCLLTAGFLLQHAANVLKLYRSDRQQGLFHGGLLLMVVLLNLAEATLLRTTHPWWIVFVASVIEVTYLTRTVPGTEAARGPLAAQRQGVSA